MTVYGWSGICIFHKMKRKRKKKRPRTRWRLCSKREMSVIWLFFSMKRDSFYVFVWEKWFLVIVIRVVVFFFIHILLRDSEWWIQISHSVKLWWEMRPYTILLSIRISYRIHDFRFFFGIGDIIWFLSGWIIFEYVIMDVRMRSNDMEICTHSSFKPYELAHRTHRHVW